MGYSISPPAGASNKEKNMRKVLLLPETNIAHENPIFPGKYHQNGGFSMAMLVSESVLLQVPSL